MLSLFNAKIEPEVTSSDLECKVKSTYEAIVAYQVGAYPGFCSMNRLGVFLLPPGWNASPSQGYPQQITGTQYTWVERGNVRVKCLAQEHSTMSPTWARIRLLGPESSALTTRARLIIESMLNRAPFRFVNSTEFLELTLNITSFLLKDYFNFMHLIRRSDLNLSPFRTITLPLKICR